jgi:hypothetical protein
MKFIIITALLGLCLSTAYAQKKDLVAIADSIEREAKVLYLSEKASWHGTDIFMDKLKDKKSLIGSYISYDTGKGVNNVFFTKGDDPNVLSTITFTYNFDLNNYKLDTVSRKLTAKEKELVKLRQAALAIVRSDTSFQHYRNTSLNVITTMNSKKVYVVTAPTVNGLIILGNDYLLTFDKKNQLITKQKIHQDIQVYNTKPNDGQVAAIHTHLPSTGAYITATDICSLMLYKDFTGWERHMVRSKEFVSIWDMRKDILAILTVEALKKIDSDKSTLDATKN